MNKPKILTGVLVGFLLTAPLVTLFFLGDLFAGLPLLTFDVFDWAARTMPGPLITFGIDLMVDTLIALNANVATVAKAAEHVLAIIGQLVMGGVFGGLFFAVLRSRLSERVEASTLGPVMGGALGIPLLAISMSVNRTASAGTAISALWILAAHVAWGGLVSWAYTHLAAHKPGGATARDASVEQVSRRQFLIRVGSASAAITVVGAGLGALATSSRGEGALAEVDGEAAPRPTSVPVTNPDATLVPAPGTRPEYTPLEDHYRIDISSRPPEVDGASWTLPITGLVEKPAQLTLDDIRNNYESMDRIITLSCISNRIGGNLIGTTKWTGVSMQDILADVGVMDDATHLEIMGADGFHETVALDLINSDSRIMLTYAWDDQPLEQRHGFPLRIWIPDRFGMKQPKWIVSIEAIGQDRPGYWVQRGWDKDAIVRTTSVIDTVAVDDIIDGDPMLVPVGGIAYAGARSISRVEVSVDGGDWTEAQLREPLSDTTWVIWRYDWPFEEGRHTFQVRCYNGDGEPQIERVASPRPSGATGIDTVDMAL